MNLSNFPKFSTKILDTKNFFLVLSALLISSCSEQTPSPQPVVPTSGKIAVIATAEPNWTGSGAHTVLSCDKPRIGANNLLPTDTTDLAISCHGKYFYRLERRNFGVNGNVTKFSLDAPTQFIYQYSTDDNGGSNPSSIIFVSDTKAYLLRNLNNKVWIINPSAQSETEFKIGELDLSSYSYDGVTPPMMTHGIINGNKLYILMQRLDSFYNPSLSSYIAVFNTDTDEEIDTGFGSMGLKGIELDVRNPYGKLILNNGTLYVAGTIWPDNPGWGTTTWTDYKQYSGIQKINAQTFQPDHNIIHNAVRTITYMDIISANKGYFVEYVDVGNTALKTFDPTTGVVSQTNVAGIGNTSDRDITDIAYDGLGFLWVSDNSVDTPGLYIINTGNDTLDEGTISTGLNPKAITFCEE
ncbi:MAG: hypothetical protein V1647_05235 [Pseudomonadota bacterium]